MQILVLLVLAVQQKNKIWSISLVSFCWSTASMMATSVLPIFLTETLHVGYAKIGYLEGIVVFCAFAAKVFSGILSDWLRKRHILILLGSILSVITKPMLALSTSYNMIFFARFIDRFAKGIRSAPTDALIADLNPENLSYAFGFRQAIYILGAVFGAILSIFIMFLIGPKYQVIFYISLIPALIAVIILLLFVKDPVFKNNLPSEQNKDHISEYDPYSLQANNKQSFVHIYDLKKFSGYYWGILFVTFFLMIARFSESFLTLKVKQFGWSVCWLPLIIIISDLSHSYFAFVSRKFATQAATERLLVVGLMVLVLANVVWLLADSNLTIIISIILTGMHLGITQGILRTLVAMSAPNIHGTAFALFYLVSGCGVFIGNLIAGVLAETFWLSTIFIGSMVASSVSLVVLLGLKFYRNKIGDLVEDSDVVG